MYYSEPSRSQEDYEQFQKGFALGYPLVGEPPLTGIDERNSEFQRGLLAGREQFEQDGRPHIQYESTSGNFPI